MTHRLLTALAAVSIAASGALVAAPASTARVLDVGAATASHHGAAHVLRRRGVGERRPAGHLRRDGVEEPGQGDRRDVRTGHAGAPAAGRHVRQGLHPGGVGTARCADHGLHLRCRGPAGHHRRWRPGRLRAAVRVLARPGRHHRGPVRLQRHRRQRRPRHGQEHPGLPPCHRDLRQVGIRLRHVHRQHVGGQQHRERQHPLAGRGRLRRVRLPHPRRPQPVLPQHGPGVGRPVL